MRTGQACDYTTLAAGLVAAEMLLTFNTVAAANLLIYHIISTFAQRI